MKNIIYLLLLQSASYLTLFADEKRSLPNVKHMIDTHIHLYNTSREGGVPWPPFVRRHADSHPPADHPTAPAWS